MLAGRFRLITFDVTDTLLKFRSSPGRQYGEIGAMFGVNCDNNAIVESFRTNWYRMNREHPNFGLTTGLGWRKWWKQQVEATFKDGTVLTLNEKKLDAISDHIMGIYETSTFWEQCYGAVDLLNHLQNSGIKMGVVSNFDVRLNTVLKNLHIDNYFSFKVNSYDAGAMKPDRIIFNKALEESGLPKIKVEEILHIGDTPALDYLGSRALGWNSILIHERDPKLLVEKYGHGINPNHVFRSLYDFQKHLINGTIKW